MDAARGPKFDKTVRAASREAGHSVWTCRVDCLEATLVRAHGLGARAVRRARVGKVGRPLVEKAPSEDGRVVHRIVEHLAHLDELPLHEMVPVLRVGEADGGAEGRA